MDVKKEEVDTVDWNFAWLSIVSCIFRLLSDTFHGTWHAAGAYALITKVCCEMDHMIDSPPIYSMLSCLASSMISLVLLFILGVV